MSIESSDLLSEGTQSDGEGGGVGISSSESDRKVKKPFSLHQYLDEVAGSDVGSDDSDSNGGGDPDITILIPTRTESGISYDIDSEHSISMEDEEMQEQVEANVDDVDIVMSSENKHAVPIQDESNRFDAVEALSMEEVEIIRTKTDEDDIATNDNDNDNDESLSAIKTESSSGKIPNDPNDNKDAELEIDMDFQMTDFKLPAPSSPPPKVVPTLSKEEIEIGNANVNQILNIDEPKPMETAINTNTGTISGISIYTPPRVHSTIAIAAANLNSPASASASTLSQKTSTPPTSIKRVRMSPFAKTTPSKRAMATPPRRSNTNANNTQSQQSPSRDSQSMRPKIISPFSPRARKMRMKQPSAGAGAGQQVEFSSQVQWSMAPSRKVSILVNVSPHIDANISQNDEENTLCLYPNVPFDEQGVQGMQVMQGQGGISGNASLGYNSPARSIRSSYSVTSQSSILNKAGPGQEVILVNPSAFGDMIPTSITVETARVVQQFSNIASEDWVRKFKFDEVCWPDVKQLVGIKKQNTNATMDDVSRATVADVVNGKSAVLFGYGVHLSGRLESMFGSIAGKGIDPFSTIGGRKSIGLELGLLGLILSKLLDKQKIEMKQMTFKVSIVEILDEDVIRDLLQKPPSSSSRVAEKSIRIRHPDNKGAIIDNAIELRITTLAEVKEAVKRAFHSKYNIQERKMVGGRGHVVATVHVFPDGEKVPQAGGKKNYSYPLLQLVDLACAESEQMEQEKASGRTKIQMNRVQNRRLGCIRQSMAGLGAILRRMVAAEVLNLPQSSMYRACTLTKLVQRALDNGKSRGIMISTVCPRRESYKQTLHALTFMHRLLVKPSKTAESPFENKGDEFDGQSFGGHHHFFSPGDQSIAHSVAYSVASTVASEAIRSEFVHAKGTKAFMKSLTTDPRQRLATLMSPKESPSFGGSRAGLPITEITTINELDNDADDDEIEIQSLPNQDTTSSHPDYESLDSSVVEKEADLSHGRFSALSDELTFGESRDGTFDNSVKSEPDTATEKPTTTFDKVLDQLDEIDAYSEDDDSEYLVSEEGSVESLQPIDTSNTFDVDEEKDNVVDILQKGKEPEGEIYVPQPVPYSRPAEPLVNTGVPDQEYQKDLSVPVTEDPIKTEVPVRPDPSGQIADELPDQNTSRVFQAHQTPTQPTDGEERPGGGGHSEEGSYGRHPDYDEFTQSHVSTLTPYDIMTGDDESESHQSEDDDHSMSSEESFSRNSSHGDGDNDDDDESFPRRDDIDIASDESFQHENDEASAEIERKINIDIPREESEDKPVNKIETGALLPGDRSRSSSTPSRSIEHVGDNVGARYENPYDDLLIESSEADASSSSDFGEGYLQDESHVSASRGRDSAAESSRTKIDPDAFYEADVYEQRVSVRDLPNQSPARLPKNDIISESKRIKNQSRQTASAILSDYLFDDSYDSSQGEDAKSPPSRTREDANSPIRASDRSSARSYEKGPQKVGIATDVRLFEDSDQYVDNTDAGDSGTMLHSDSMLDSRHDATTEPPFQDESYPEVNVGTSDGDLDTKNHPSGRSPVNTGLASSVSVNPVAVRRNVDENSSTVSFLANLPDDAQIRNDDSGSPHDDSTSQSAFREITTEISRKTQNSDSLLPFKGARNPSTTSGIAQPSVNQTPQGNVRDEDILCDSDGSQSTGTPDDQDDDISITHQANRLESETRNKDRGEDEPSVDPILSNPSTNQPYAGAYLGQTDVNETKNDELPNVDMLNDQDSSNLSADLSATTPVEAAFRDHTDNLDYLSGDQSGSVSFSAEDGLCESSNILSEVVSESEQDELFEHPKRVPVTESLVSSVAKLSEQVQDQLTDLDGGGDTPNSVSKTRITKREVDFESPSRTVKKSVVHEAKSLVIRSDALRAYSPDGKSDPTKSLNSYKTMLMESLKALDGEMEGSSIGGLSSDGEDYDERETSFDSAVSSKFRSYSAGITAQEDLACPASDESSNDGDSLDFDPVPSEEFQSDIDNISSQKRSSTNKRPSRSEIPPTIQSEIKRLQESLKQCVDSTNESEVITGLANDNFDIAQTLNSDEEPIVRTIKQLTSQTEALQTFINSTLDQLQESRLVERSKQQEIAETNLRLEETLDEIQSLRSSNRDSIDQIKQDHLDSLNEALEKEIKKTSDIKARVEYAAREETERNLRSSSAAEQEEKELLKSSISALKQEIEDMKNQLVSSNVEQQRLAQLHNNEVASLVEELDKNDAINESQSSQLRNLVQELQTQLQDQKSRGQRLESSLESEKAISINVTERLDSELNTHSTLKYEIRKLESRLADEIIVNKDATLNLKGRYEEQNRTLKHTLEGQIKTLQKRLNTEERQKDDLEDRLTDEVNSLQHILESKAKQNADLKDSVISLRSEVEERMKCEGGDKQALHNDINKLRERVANETSAKHELEASLLSENSKLKSALDGNVKSNKRLQNEMEERLKSERNERSALDEKILSLHGSLERERREKKETVSRFTSDISILEGDLNSRNNVCAELEETLASMKYEYNKHLESERNDINKLSEKVDELEEKLNISEAQGRLSIENSKMRISELQDDLIENNMMNSELKHLLEDTRSQCEEESNLRTNLDQKVQDLEERLGNETLEKYEKQSELMEKIKALEKSLKLKDEEHSLIKNKHGDRLKLEGIEKASLEDEIQTLQERLQEEAQERDDIEARLTNKVARMKDELALNKKRTDDLGYDLEDARQGLESTIKLLDSEKHITISLEQNNVSLREQIEEDAMVIGQLKESLSGNLLVQEEELVKKSQIIKELSDQLSDFEQKLAELNSHLTSERNEKNSLASELFVVQLNLDKELKERQEQEDLLQENIDALKNNIQGNLKENSTLSQEVESLKKEHDHLQGKLVKDLTERMQEKASSDAQLSSLELELHDRANQLDDLNETLDRMRGENERLEDHLEVEIGKLTSELTERMKEKAKYETDAATLEAMLEESNQERDTLRDDLSTQRQIFVKLEDRMTAEVEARSCQEDSYLRRIEHLENALNDCCKSKEELNELIRILELEKGNLNRQVASLTSERDVAQQQVNDSQEDREALEQEIFDTTIILNEVKSELRSALDSVKDLESEKQVAVDNFSKNVAKWENRLGELSTDLAKETTLRLQEKTDHSGRISAMISEAEKQRQSLLNQVSNAEEKFSMLQDKMKSELEREQSIHANDEAMISALNSKLDAKDRIAREMQAKLEDTERDLLLLNERLTDMSEEHSEATRVHTELSTSFSRTIQEKDEKIRAQSEEFNAELDAKDRIAREMQAKLEDTERDLLSLNERLVDMSEEHSEAIRVHTELSNSLSRTIQEKDENIRAQAKDNAGLQEEINRLYQTLKEEIESYVKSEKSNSANVSKLQQIVSTRTIEIEEITSQLSRQKADIERATHKLEKEMDDKTKLEKNLLVSQHDLNSHRSQTSDLQGTIQTLQDELARSKTDANSQREQMNQIQSEVAASKRKYESEKRSFHDAFETKQKEIKTLYRSVQIMEKTVEDKDGFITDLKNTVDELKVSLESQMTKVYSLSMTKDANGDKMKGLAQEVISLKDKMARERTSQSSELEKVNTHLDSKVSENNSLKESVESARQDNDELKRTMEDAREESIYIQQEFTETLQRAKEDLKARILELEDDKRSRSTTTKKRFEELSTRISDLSIMKENLQSENVSLIEKVREEKQSCEKILKKNKQLKTALSENETKVRNEMNELEFTMNSSISKIELKRKKAIEEEKAKMSLTLDKLEDENDSYKIKITQLESAIRRLERQSSMGIRGRANIDSQEEADRLRNENERLTRRIRILETTESSTSYLNTEEHRTYRGTPGLGDRRPGTPGSPGGDGPGNGNVYYIVEYRLERERRIKAEEFAAAMAARAKAGFEDRNEEIVGLRMKVSSLESEKENFDHQRQLTLTSSASLQNPTNLLLALQERNEALEEAQTYKSIANELNEKVVMMDEMIGAGENAAAVAVNTSSDRHSFEEV